MRFQNISIFTCVTGSFMINTSVTFPNIPKYSLSLSPDVCQLRPPTNNFPGAESIFFLISKKNIFIAFESEYNRS